MKSKLCMILCVLASFNQTLCSDSIMQTVKQMTVETIKSSAQAIVNSFSLENCTRGNATKFALAAAATYFGYKAKQKFYPDKGIHAHTFKNIGKEWIGAFPQKFEQLLNNKESYKALKEKGLTVPNAYLFCGKPNTGKTTLVRILSKKLEIPVIQVDGDRFLFNDKTKIDVLFKDILKVAHACKTQTPFKSIICIDNIDDLISPGFTDPKKVLSDVINHLIKVSNDKENRDILFIVSTKDKEKVEYKKLTLIEITPPNEEIRKTVIIQTLKKHDLELDEKTMATTIQETEGFLVTQLTELLENVATARILDKESDILTLITDILAKQKEQPDIPKDAAKDWYGPLPEKFEQLLKSKKYSKTLAEKGLKPHNGYLLHGAPGTGKTLAAQVLAERLQVPLIKTNSGQFIKKLQGSGNERLQEILTKAHGYNPQAPFKCIIFIDELDGLKRNRREGSSNGEEDRLVNDLLATITDEQNKDILFIGATNFIDKIDEALQRDGRLVPVKVELPTNEIREALFTNLLKKYTVTLDAKVLDMSELLKRTKGYSSATIDALITDALRNHIMDEHSIKSSFTQHLKLLLENKMQEQRKQKESPQQEGQIAKEEEEQEEELIPDPILHTMYS